MAFARRAGLLTRIPPLDAVKRFTSFASTFEAYGFLHPSLSYSSPLVYMADAYYAFYLATMAPKEQRGPFGHFGHWKADDGCIHMRFHGGPGVLDGAAIVARTYELHRLFDYLMTAHPPSTLVKGFSWLYNLPTYAALFPPDYISAAEIVSAWFRSGALWGQVARGDGGLRSGIVRAVLDQADRARSEAELDRCFQFRVLSPCATLGRFCEYYRLD